MREIKFKIWSEIDKKFLENPHYINSNGIIFFSACKGPVIDYEDQEKYKILQYTGLKDKNGKEIYIGDIVKFKSMATKDYQTGYINEYRWSKNGNCQYGLKIYQNKIYNGQDNLERTNIDNPTNIEIIGNNYENPNLLENGKV